MFCYFNEMVAWVICFLLFSTLLSNKTKEFLRTFDTRSISDDEIVKCI